MCYKQAAISTATTQLLKPTRLAQLTFATLNFLICQAALFHQVARACITTIFWLLFHLELLDDNTLGVSTGGRAVGGLILATTIICNSTNPWKR